MKALLILVLIAPLTLANRGKCDLLWYQYPYFNMVPIYMAKSTINEPQTQVLKNIQGNCFEDITIYTEYQIN